MNESFHLRPRDYLGEASRKRHLNERLFTVVAPRYDAINRLLSFNRDPAWKDRLVRALPARTAPLCLDLACGTGDLTARLARKYPQGRVLGLDLTEAMLDIARRRVGLPNVEFRRGDMACTGLPAGSVDFVTGGYALRNAADLDEALAEVHRVLKPGGRADFLDFSKPSGRVGQAVTHGLLKLWGGFWGLLLHRNPDVYGYIADSLDTYPDRRELRLRMEQAGLCVHASRRFFFGVIEWLTVCKPEAANAAGAGRTGSP